MDYANKKEVEQLLLKSDISSYRISKETGISEATLNKYRRGDSSLENMTFGNAIKLQKYFLELEGENGLVKKNFREENFARALAVLNAIGNRRFENGKPSVDVAYKTKMDVKPMTIFAKAHQDVMQYSQHFDAIDLKLFDRINDYIGVMDTSSFNDDRLDPVYLLYFSKETVKLNELVKNEERKLK